jgi:hypothetical protein
MKFKVTARKVKDFTVYETTVLGRRVQLSRKLCAYCEDVLKTIKPNTEKVVDLGAVIMTAQAKGEYINLWLTVPATDKGDEQLPF